LLRQRFWGKSLAESPLLIEDVRVEFRQRCRPNRNAVSAEEAIPTQANSIVRQQFLFALTELLSGNVSYRLREKEWIHWTPIPKEGESTFLYPTEAELDEEQNVIGEKIIPFFKKCERLRLS